MNNKKLTVNWLYYTTALKKNEIFLFFTKAVTKFPIIVRLYSY